MLGIIYYQGFTTKKIFNPAYKKHDFEHYTYSNQLTDHCFIWLIWY
jgi:hypothetical protein